jgi:hypothetical protein
MLRPLLAGILLFGALARPAPALARALSPVAFERMWQAVVEDAQPIVRPRSVSAVTGIVRGATIYRRPLVGGLAEAIAENGGPRRLRVEIAGRGFIAELEEEGGRCSLHVEANAGLPIFSAEELRADPALRALQRLLAERPRGHARARHRRR